MNLDHKDNLNGFDEKDELKKQGKTADPEIFVVGVGPWLKGAFDSQGNLSHRESRLGCRL